MIGSAPRALPANASAMPPQAFESSSVTSTMFMVRESPAIPSNPSSMNTRNRSACAIFSTTGHGNSPFVSYSAATGRISFSAMSRARSRIAVCSSVR